MGFWKNVFSDKSPDLQFKERMAKEAKEKQEQEDKQSARDQHFKSKSFFEKQIKSTSNYIEEVKEEYINKKRKKTDFDFSGYFDDFNMEFLNLINAKYSQGQKVTAIIKDANAIMETVSKNWTPEFDFGVEGKNLLRLNDSIAIGILARVDQSYFEDLSTIMEEKNFHDFLSDYLINSQLPNHEIAKDLLIKDNKPFNLLVEIIKAKDKKDAEQKIKHFLDKIFYTNQNLSIYYKRHEFDNGRIYFGYWAWVVAAIVRIKGLNDSSFRNNPYYPYDFVHWKEEPPKKKTLLAE